MSGVSRQPLWQRLSCESVRSDRRGPPDRATRCDERRIVIHFQPIEEPEMPDTQLLSGYGLAHQNKRLKGAVNGALDATKRYPQYRFERFIEALHAAGFDVQELPGGPIAAQTDAA